ncbi:MAG: 50S ribosomal protein L23 [Parcubacteria group bacterium]|nr:50S ribosomal protein L23 [Parcubacteria group bacterium]
MDIQSLKAADRLVLERPHVTEKGTYIGAFKQYVFRVGRRTTKPQIKKAVEKLYGVKVVSVNVVSVPAKSKRLGRRSGFVPGYRKAMVTLKEGKIDLG